MSAVASESRSPASAPVEAGASIRECLSFRLGQEEYGIDILRVQEIRGYEKPTRIAGAPEFIRGVVNLRGVVVPIVDLRLRFGLDAGFDSTTVTVLLNLAGRTVGAVVDSVSDVVQLTAAHVKPAPEFSGAVDARYINGIAVIEQGESQRMLILVDIEQLMASSDIGLAASIQ